MFTLTPKIALSALLALTTLSSVQGAPSGQLILQEQPQVLPAYEIPEMMEELKGKKLNINSTVKLNNGIEIPVLGFGVYQSPPDVTNRSVSTALEAGYRHIDSAQVYRNEAQSGLAIHNSPYPRSSIFLTTKLRWSVPYPEIYSSLRESIKKIGLGGVRHLEEMKEYAKIPPVINQIELHPWCQQRAIVAYCQTHNIAIEAYSPLVQGKKANDPTLLKVAEEVGRGWAKVLIRWSLQKGYITLPKSDTPSRIYDNKDVFDFELNEDQMKRLDALADGGDEHIAWDPTGAP